MAQANAALSFQRTTLTQKFIAVSSVAFTAKVLWSQMSIQQATQEVFSKFQ